MRTFVAGLVSATLLFGCELEQGEDSPDTGGASGEGASGGRAGGSAGTFPGSGGAAGSQSASGGTGPSGGSGGKAGAGTSGSGGTGVSGSSGVSGSGGTGVSGSGGSSDGGAGPSGGKGGNLGGAGSGMGGAGAGGSGGSAGSAAGSGGECTQNLGCKLDPPPSTGDVHQDCIDRINQFRTECACMPPLERWTEGEDCADQMAEYDSRVDQAHAGFRDNICSPGGSAQNECPGYRSETQVVGLCLQQMWDEGPPPEDPCEGACFQEYGHFINMTNTRYTKVACGFYTAGNEVWSVQNFSR